MTNVEAAIRELRPGSCILILTRDPDGTVKMISRRDDILVISLRSIRDKSELEYALAMGRRVVCISSSAGLLSEYALSRLSGVVILDDEYRRLGLFLEALALKQGEIAETSGAQ